MTGKRDAGGRRGATGCDISSFLWRWLLGSSVEIRGFPYSIRSRDISENISQAMMLKLILSKELTVLSIVVDKILCGLVSLIKESESKSISHI